MDLKHSVSQKSNFYEKLVEHVLISEILQETWFKFNKTVEVLRPEIDASGYDLVLECNGIIRHIQLKISLKDSKKSKVPLNLELASKISGCAIWIEWELKENNRVNLKYLFFGNEPGKPLPNISDNKVARHSKANAQGEKKERPNIREVKKTEFKPIDNINALICILFNL